MTDNLEPRIIKFKGGPFVRCRICEQVLPLPPIDRRTGRIPHHQRWDEPKYVCPGSGKRFSRQDLVDN